MNDIHPLVAFRQRRDLTQQQLADLLGVHRVELSRWETGDRRISAGKLPQVVEKTGIAPAELRPDLAPVLKSAAQ